MLCPFYAVSERAQTSKIAALHDPRRSLPWSAEAGDPFVGSSLRNLKINIVLCSRPVSTRSIMVNPIESKSWRDTVLQEREDLVEENSEVILDQEPPSEFASRLPNYQRESQEALYGRKLEQLLPNFDPFSLNNIPVNDPRWSHIVVPFLPIRLVPPLNLSAGPVFRHQILPLPVPTGPRRLPEFAGAMNAPSRPSPDPYYVPAPSPHTKLPQLPRHHPDPLNTVPVTSQNEGQHRTWNLTPPLTTQAIPQYTYADLQTPTGHAAGGIPGAVLQPPYHFTHQPTPRAASMLPYIMPNRSSSRPEYQAMDGVVDADIQPLMSQNAGPYSMRRRSLSPLQNAGPYRQRSPSPRRHDSMPTFQNTEQSPYRSPRLRMFQSIPLTNSETNQAPLFWDESPPPYENDLPSVYNVQLPFQNVSPYSQNGMPHYKNGLPYCQNGSPYSQNGYFQKGQRYYETDCSQDGQSYYQDGYIQNGQPNHEDGCLEDGYNQSGQPYYQNDPPPFQSYPFPIPNYSLPFDNCQLPSPHKGGQDFIPHFEAGSGFACQPPNPGAESAHSAGNNPSFKPILNSQLAVLQAPSPPSASRLPQGLPIAPNSPVSQVPLLDDHSMEEESHSTEEEPDPTEEDPHSVEVESDSMEEESDYMEEESDSMEEESSDLFSPPVGIMRHLYWTCGFANTLGL